MFYAETRTCPCFFPRTFQIAVDIGNPDCIDAVHRSSQVQLMTWTMQCLNLGQKLMQRAQLKDQMHRKVQGQKRGCQIVKMLAFPCFLERKSQCIARGYLEQEGSVRTEGWRYFLMSVLQWRWPMPIVRVQQGAALRSRSLSAVRWSRACL